MSAKRIYYTEYESTNAQDPSKFDPEWLEETNLSEGLIEEIKDAMADMIVNGADVEEVIAMVRDLDGDGYLEIKKTVLEDIAEREGGPVKTFRLAPYFADQKSDDKKRLAGLPAELKLASESYSFMRARNYFTNRAGQADDRLYGISKDLAKHLSATAMHSGLLIYQPLNNPSGFSVYGDGRLRFSCIQYAQLAYSDLMDIPDLEFHYVLLDPKKAQRGEIKAVINQSTTRPHEAESGPQVVSYPIPDGLNDGNGSNGHETLLVTDKRTGRHLFVSNNEVTLFDTDPHSFIKDEYRKKHKKYDFIDPATGERTHFSIKKR